MIDYENLQARCQRGEPSLSAANNLLAECHAAIGRLIAENERVESLVSSERDRVMSIIGQYGHFEDENKRLQSAARTLERIGYKDHGGELWKPQLGECPDFNLVDQLKAENETLRAELAGLRTGFDAQNEVIAGLRKDAERWRFVRNAIPNQSPFAVYREGSRPFFGKWADEAIDDAMGKGGEA